MKRTCVFGGKSICRSRNPRHEPRFLALELLETRQLMASDAATVAAFDVAMPSGPSGEAVSALVAPSGSTPEEVIDQAASLFTNPANRLDVDDDGQVTTADVARIIEDINTVVLVGYVWTRRRWRMYPVVTWT